MFLLLKVENPNKFSLLLEFIIINSYYQLFYYKIFFKLTVSGVFVPNMTPCQWIVLFHHGLLVNFKNLTGFVQWFTNQAASNLADGKEPWGAVQNKFYRQMGAGTSKLH